MSCRAARRLPGNASWTTSINGRWVRYTFHCNLSRNRNIGTWEHALTQPCQHGIFQLPRKVRTLRSAARVSFHKKLSCHAIRDTGSGMILSLPARIHHKNFWHLLSLQPTAAQLPFQKGASKYDVYQIFRFFDPLPNLSAFGSDLYYRIHASFHTMSAFPWPTR